MTGAVLIRSMDPQDATTVADLIVRSFHGSLASSWPAAAIQDFERYIDVSSLKRRIESHHQHWVAEKDGIIVGILELRHGRQITLFFVDKRFRSAGVGRRLLHVAERNACFRADDHQRVLRVHACLPVVPLYLRLGFHPTGQQKARNGLLFTSLERITSHPTPGC